MYVNCPATMPRHTISLVDLRLQTEQLLQPGHPVRMAISELPDELEIDMYERLARGWLKILSAEMAQASR